jgi:hypothetical protein
MADYAQGVADNLTADVKDVGRYKDSGDYLGKLQTRLAAARALAERVRKLAAMGMPQSLVDEILAMGIEDGSKAAEALMSGMNSGTATAIISAHKEIDALGTSLGSSLSQQYYKAGVNAAQGLVDGLESKIATLEKTMARLSDSMVKAIKKALGIKSPSRVFMDVAALAMEGLGVGIERGGDAVVRTMGEAADRTVAVAREKFDPLEGLTVRPPAVDLKTNRGVVSLPDDGASARADDRENAAKMLRLLERLPGLIAEKMPKQTALMHNKELQRLLGTVRT